VVRVLGLRYPGVFSVFLAALASMGLAQESSVVDSVVINQIDNDRARNDIARAKESGFQESIDFPGAARFGDFSPVVPILIPMKVFQDLRAGLAGNGIGAARLDSANGESSISFNDNGYFATSIYPDQGFTLTVEGTNRAFVKSNDDAPGFAGVPPDYINVYTNSASFGYAGADYLVLVECIDGDDAECISELDIRKLLQEFVLCSVDNECVNSFPIDAEEPR
jgi:hypothetical protein